MPRPKPHEELGKTSGAALQKGSLVFSCMADGTHVGGVGGCGTAGVAAGHRKAWLPLSNVLSSGEPLLGAVLFPFQQGLMAPS